MRIPFVLLLLLAPAISWPGDTYTWLDENNERHWSDTPHPGAEKVDLTPQGGYHAPPVREPYSAPLPVVATTPVAVQCSITQPGNEEVLFEADSATISVQTTAPGGAVVSATLDGASLPPTQPGGASFLVSPIDRGTHVAAAVVRDASGRVLCSASPVTFYVRQHSVVRPR
jgi:hypothetical protein